jgi:hypothetical protein
LENSCRKRKSAYTSKAEPSEKKKEGMVRHCYAIWELLKCRNLETHATIEV